MGHDAKTQPADAGMSRRTTGLQKRRKGSLKKGSNITDIRLEISDILDSFPFYVLLIDENHHILQANSAVLC